MARFVFLQDGGTTRSRVPCNLREKDIILAEAYGKAVCGPPSSAPSMYVVTSHKFTSSKLY